jgi:hypothetical protein
MTYDGTVFVRIVQNNMKYTGSVFVFILQNNITCWDSVCIVQNNMTYTGTVFMYWDSVYLYHPKQHDIY